LTVISSTLCNSVAYQTFSLEGDLLNQKFVRELTELPDLSTATNRSSHAFLLLRPNRLVVDYSSYRTYVPVRQCIGVHGQLPSIDPIAIPGHTNVFLVFDFFEQTLGVTKPSKAADPWVTPSHSSRLLTWNSIIYNFDSCLYRSSEIEHIEAEFTFPYAIYDQTTNQISTTRSGFVTSLPLLEICPQTLLEDKPVSRERCSLDVLGNDRYLVMVIQTAFFVFYFDPDIKIPRNHLQMGRNNLDTSNALV
jgi:hypothetical protein